MNLATEEKLWNYIDGFCSPAEQDRIRLLIETEPEIRQKYNELRTLQADLDLLAPEEPSMAFTFKVMEKISAEKVIVPLKTRISKPLIYGIAGFFTLMIMLLLALAFANVNWHNAAPAATLPQLNIAVFTHVFSPLVIKAFLFCDMILALFFADHYFRKWFFQQK